MKKAGTPWSRRVCGQLRHCAKAYSSNKIHTSTEYNSSHLTIPSKDYGGIGNQRLFPAYARGGIEQPLGEPRRPGACTTVKPISLV